MSAPRVFVTGIGMVTPLGLDVQSTWDGIKAGRSGVARITAFNPEGFETQIAAEVKGFDPHNFMDRKEARRLDRFSHARHRVWARVSGLNRHHMFFAWTSLFGVGFADFYVWMVASGRITDLRLF